MMIIKLVTGFSLALGIIAGATGTAMSAIDISGVYIGSFTSTCGNGTFALLVSSDHSAVLLAFSINQSDRSVDQREDLAVDPDGSLRFSGFLGRSASVQVTFARRAVDGTITGACDGEIAGDKSRATGFMADAGGYYVGSHDGTIEQEECVAFGVIIIAPFCTATGFTFVGTYSGPIFAIIAADGRGYRCVRILDSRPNELHRFPKGLVVEVCSSLCTEMRPSHRVARHTSSKASCTVLIS